VTEDDLKRVQMDEAWQQHREQKARARGDEHHVPPHKGSAQWYNAPKSEASVTPKPTPVARQLPLEAGDRVRWDRRKSVYNEGVVIDPSRRSSVKVRFDDNSAPLFIPASELALIPA
jgi:hypothetical protein